MLNETRKLASLATIDHIRAIPDADAIDCGTVRGWPVVIGKGDFANGDSVLYIEPDAALPLSDPRFAFLAPRGTKTIEDAQYHVLRTVRLRGQLSQGIVFPVEKFPEVSAPDIDAALGLKLYEPPQPPMGSEAIGSWNLPWLKKTDAERVQNLSDEWLASVNDGLWVPTEKVDGTSVTYALDDETNLHLYSRNWELATDDASATPMVLAARYELRAWMADRGVAAVQAEMYGNSIQSNRLRVQGHNLAVFAAWAKVEGQAEDRFDVLMAPDSGLPVAPVFRDLPFPRTVEEALAQADGLKSLINPERLAEGIVWHHLGDAAFPELDYRLVFKAVSPAYLIKHGL